MSAPLTPVELAGVAVKQQAALLADARQQLDRAAATRSACEHDVSAAETAHTTALQASSSERSNDKLADAASRAGVRLQHARDDLSRAIKSHTAAAATAATGEANLGAAERAHELARLQAGLTERMQAPIVGELVEVMLESALTLRRSLVHLRELQAADAADVRRIAELGGRAQPADGTPFAGHLAKFLLSNGGLLHAGNPAELRWLFEDEQPTRDPEGTHGASRIAQFALAAIAFGERQSKASGPVESTGRKALQMASVWAKYRTKTEGEAATDALTRSEGESRSKVLELAHAERLRKAGEAAKKPPGRVVGDIGGRPYQRGSAPVAEGEFLIGDPDDFSGRSRPPAVG